MPSINFHRLIKARIALWGYGLENQSVLRAIREQLPEKRVDVIVSPEEAQLWDFEVDPWLKVVTDPVGTVLGYYQYVFKSPGISPYDKAVEWAHFRGTRFISGSNLWFAEHPYLKTICVTGSKGKSTTSSLIAHLLRHARQRTALAGNIGLPLLDVPMQPPVDWWVIELSSYQTHDFCGVPACAVVLNLFPEHLNWHGGSEEQYYADKLRILADGKAEVAVLNGADAELMRRTAQIQRKVLFNVTEGWHVSQQAIYRGTERVLDLHDLRLAGPHNASNVCAALAALEACGFDALSLAPHARTFQPLPHRLQRLGNRGGVEWVNDSIATTPHATIAALQSLGGRPTTVIVGGFDRGVSWQVFAEHIQQQPPNAVVVQGANASVIAQTINSALQATGVQSAIVPDLAAAVVAARELTPAGGTVLMSPGAASFDQFEDYVARGEAFAQLAGFDGSQLGMIEGLGVA